jgi:uncharacterized circularly permuted ATP-grasp superfamily protein
MATEQQLAEPRAQKTAMGAHVSFHQGQNGAGQQQQQFSSEMLNFHEYDVGPFYDEMFDELAVPRADCEPLFERMQAISADDLSRRKHAAARSMLQLGITFAVYGDQQGSERIIPFDIVPRIIRQTEWEWMERGLKQRIAALNAFLQDIYHDQKIVRDGVIPEHVIATASGFREACVGLTPPKGIWCHITGTDLVRDGDGQLYVLEDNMRCPSGVSYVLQNRQLMKQTFPQLFERTSIQPVDDYCSRLLDALQYLMDDQVSQPTVALLSPGSANSAYFEHSFLAQQMGIDLVEGRDLAVQDGFVYMRTTKGMQRIDVLYRRIDDNFLDPLAFRPDSMLGVPGLFGAYWAGRIALANAPGTGVADDKVVYAYVPQMIKYYLDEEEILPNVPTYVCWDDAQRDHVLKNLDKLVVKPANEAGGYGLLIGPMASKAERETCADQIRDNPRNFVAQPTLSLSRVPVLTEDGLEGRHVDLRPFIIQGEETYVLPGGLTRVALKKGTLVVNSSQGGGSKDTWVVA